MEELLMLLQQKLIQLECYQSVSNRLLHEDLNIESGILEIVLDEREGMIGEYEATEEQLSKCISSLPMSDAIRLILAGDTEYAAKYPQVAQTATRIAAVTTSINHLDKEARIRIVTERDRILALIKSSEKTNRVATYMRQTNFDTTRGASFNFKS
jgi:hypothetical protein